jgi:tellurite resistance protein
MVKVISKTEAIKILNQVEILEILQEAIDRNETVPSKQTKINRFINAIQKQVKEDRDVILIAVKVK